MIATHLPTFIGPEGPVTGRQPGSREERCGSEAKPYGAVPSATVWQLAGDAMRGLDRGHSWDEVCIAPLWDGIW